MEGTVRSVDAVSWVGGPVAEVTVADDTSVLVLAFFALSRGLGLRTGDTVVTRGVVGRHDGRRVMLSPVTWRPAGSPGR